MIWIKRGKVQLPPSVEEEQAFAAAVRAGSLEAANDRAASPLLAVEFGPALHQLHIIHVALTLLSYRI
ncbi:hypothetical protein D3C85_1768290 [compost metagenome]